MNTEEKLADLETRLAHQEHLHRDISLDPDGFVHGVVTNLPMIITAIVLSVITVMIINKYR